MSCRQLSCPHRSHPHSSPPATVLPGGTSTQALLGSPLLSPPAVLCLQALVCRLPPLSHHKAAATGGRIVDSESRTSVSRSGSQTPAVEVWSRPGSQAGPFPVSPSFCCCQQPWACTCVTEVSVSSFTWPSLLACLSTIPFLLRTGIASGPRLPSRTWSYSRSGETCPYRRGYLQAAGVGR